LPDEANSIEERVEFLIADYCDAVLLEEAEAEMHRWRALREKMENSNYLPITHSVVSIKSLQRPLHIGLLSVLTNGLDVRRWDILLSH